jgi:hypothetical protein
VDHIDDGVRCGGEFIGIIVTKRVATEIAVSMIVVVIMVSGGGESRGCGLEEDCALGALILLEAAAFVFLPAAAVARIVASDLRFGHRVEILPSWSEDVEHTIEEILRDPRFYELLLGFDWQIAEAVQADRCGKCGAALHWGAYFTPCRSWISPYAGPRFHVMPVQDFTACRSKISRQAGQDFTENQAGKF